MIQTLKITGMTCQNCVRHVTEALQAVPGVQTAEVELAAGTARIRSERAIPRETFAAALDEAGYALA